MKNNYEKTLSLAVNYGFSHDLQENCQKFFSELLKQSQSMGVAIWLNNYPEQSKAVYAFYDKKGFYRKDNKVFLPEYPLEIPESKDFLRLLPGDDLFEEFMVEGYPASGCIEIYKLDNLGFIQLFYKNKPKAEETTRAYLELFSHFAAFLKLCLEHEKLENDCKESGCVLSGLNQSDIIVILTDSLGRVKFVNNAFTSIYGCSREEIINRPFETILSHLPDKDKIVEIRRLLKLKKSWSGRIKNTIRNGELKDFYVAISPFNIKGCSGNIIFFKDITSEIFLEENLRHSKKLQAVSAMAASIVSDFEAILADVTGMLVNAAESSDVSRNLQTLLGDSLNKIDGAQQLLRQLKLFSCDRNFDEKPVEIARVLEETIKVLRASLPVTISLISEVDYRGHVKADANQLQQIILSLGTNAFKAIRSQGEILFKLREPSLYELQLLGNKRPGRLWICLEVIDNGCGIPPENIGKVFDPFFTSSKINNSSGLGLAVIQAMVERMGGCIKVESKIEEGSKFVVYFPLSEDEKSIEAKNISNSNSDTEKTRVIVVDDEEMICKIYRMGLKRYGYEVTSFTDSERALKAFQHRPGNFDLLITDMMMPKINGDELTRQMLSIRPDLPVILCSGFISELDEQKLQDSGIKKCIEKPLDVAELDKAIKSLLY